MNFRISVRRCAAAVVFGAILLNSGMASAVSLRTTLSSIYQYGNGATVQVGHTAVASTSYNRLYAGGTFVAACASPDMLPYPGQRFISGEKLVGGVRLTVTIPEWHPAFINMPGFNAAALRGQRLNCTYAWTSRAVEGNFSVGPGGVGFTTGGGEANDGGTQLFSMNVPALADEDEWTSCYP